MSRPLLSGRGRPARVRRGLALVAVLVAFAPLGGGCGLPSRSEPKYAGPAQSPAATQGGQKTPPKFTGGLTSEQLVERFLQASVGANLGGGVEGSEPDANKEALDRMKQFMVPATAEAWHPSKPGPGLVIVRDPKIEPEPNGAGRDTVALKLTPLGVLNGSGEVTPWTGTPPTATFSTVLVSGQRRLQEVPSDNMYISESGLREWYTQQPIYFWSSASDSPQLVPDLRYMPSTLPPVKQVAETLHWLQIGPSELLQGNNLVAKWPTSLEIKDNPVIEDNDVRLNLSGKAASLSKDDLLRAARQVRWSLPDHKPVKLAIENQDFGVDSDGYLDYNPAVDASSVDQSKVYVIVNETVRSAALGPGLSENPLFAPGGQNKNVVAAALNRQGNRAALVTKPVAGKAEQHLLVYAPDQSVGGAPKYTDVGIVAPRLSRPAWVTYPVKRLMITDGGRLWVSRTEEGNKEYDPVEFGALSSAAITAFAVAPEGRRIAFISDRQLMVAPLFYDKDNNKFSIGTAQAVTTSLGDNQAVGWLTETTLAVGGKPSPKSVHPLSVGNDGPRYNIVAVTIDGALEEPLPAFARNVDATTDVTELVTRVNRPGFPPDYSIVSEANGVAQRMYSSSNDPIQLTPEQNPAALPTSPFFAD